MKAISIGVSKVTIDGTSLGSNTQASISLQPVIVPVHTEKVGSGMVVGNRLAVKSLQGTLNVTTEELPPLSSLFSKMRKVINGERYDTASFSCFVPLCGGSMTGEIAILPQFSSSCAFDSWANVTLNLPIIGPLDLSAGGIKPTVISGIPFITDSSGRADTIDKNNLCFSNITCSVADSIVEANVSGSCQIRPIFRGTPPWPVDYVVDGVSIQADVGCADFSNSLSLYQTDSSFEVTFHCLSGSLKFNLRDKCLVQLAGLKTSQTGVNTWLIRAEGNSI